MSKKNKTHDSVIDIFYYEMFALFVGILIVIGWRRYWNWVR